MASPSAAPAGTAVSFDLARESVRELNQRLHAGEVAAGRDPGAQPGWPPQHRRRAGRRPYEVEIEGHVGYYCAGMNKQASVRVHGNCGTGVAENMMSGTVVIEGSASQSAAASARGGLLVIGGDASARCGISLKGAEIVVRGSVGHMSAFMAQKGCLVVCGDAGEALGDSLYEARLYVRGAVAGLGADCIEKEMRAEHVAQLRDLLARAEVDARSGRLSPLRVRSSALQLQGRQSARVLRWPLTRMRAATAGTPACANRPPSTATRSPTSSARRATGIYDIRGFGAKRRVPHFDDLLFLGASMSRYPLEGYRERCATDVTIGTRFAREPIKLDIPITIAGMSFGALSGNAKEALGRGASEVGTSTTTGDGGMTPEEREHSSRLVYQLLPSRYGMNPDDLRRADAIEVVVGQGAKPGGGGMLLGHKISDRVAEMRDLPKGIDQRSACRHPDWTGLDDLEIKIEELREITDWRIPIYIKIGASRTYYDTALAVKAGADAIVLDGMQGGTAATQEVFIEHVGIPILAAIPQAVESLNELGMHREVQLIVSGGIRTGADVAKALALGADAVSIGVAAMIALGDNAPEHDAGYREIDSAAGYYDDWQAGLDPAGYPPRRLRWPPAGPRGGGRRLANYCHADPGGADAGPGVRQVPPAQPEPEDLVALTIEASAMARVPLAGPIRIPGMSA